MRRGGLDIGLCDPRKIRMSEKVGTLVRETRSTNSFSRLSDRKVGVERTRSGRSGSGSRGHPPPPRPPRPARWIWCALSFNNSTDRTRGEGISLEWEPLVTSDLSIPTDS
eukprot:1179480-Prorocentrum_minimum.AAC.2